MDRVQQASFFFFVPLVIAYLSACVGWLALVRLRPALWPAPVQLESKRPYLDLGLSILAVIFILLLGQAFRAGFLLPTKGQGLARHLAWIIDNLIIYSPIFLTLALRRQRLGTIFLSGEGIHKKLAIGIVLGIFSMALFLALRGEVTRMPAILSRVLELKRIVDFVPIFLEGVALAFLFVRLRWALGLWIALLLPALLFAFAHIPNHVASGLSALEIIVFVLMDSTLVAVILYVVQRSRDIIWLGVVHYLMDLAISAI
jgi:hypothetical protein